MEVGVKTIIQSLLIILITASDGMVAGATAAGATVAVGASDGMLAGAGTVVGATAAAGAGTVAGAILVMAGAIPDMDILDMVITVTIPSPTVTAAEARYYIMRI